MALGEVKDSQKYKSCLKGGTVSDIVTATTQDYIYFYHIDSCMAAAFFPNDSKSPVIGAHLALNAPNNQWKDESWQECAEYYIKQLSEHIGKIGCAAFVGGTGDWGAAAAKLTKGLSITNAVFLPVDKAVDAWALPGIDSAVALLEWNKDVGFRHVFPKKDCEETKKMSTVQGLVGPVGFTSMYDYV